MPSLAAELERHPGIWRGSELARADYAESLERAQQLLGALRFQGDAASLSAQEGAGTAPQIVV